MMKLVSNPELQSSMIQFFWGEFQERKVRRFRTDLAFGVGIGIACCGLLIALCMASFFYFETITTRHFAAGGVAAEFGVIIALLMLSQWIWRRRANLR